jgi:hypothetical protein
MVLKGVLRISDSAQWSQPFGRNKITRRTGFGGLCSLWIVFSNESRDDGSVVSDIDAGLWSRAGPLSARIAAV